MPSEDAKAMKKEDAEEDNKSLSSFVKKKPTNANNGGSASKKLKKEEINEEDDDDDNKPIKLSLSGSRSKPVKKKEIVEDDDEKPLSKRNSSVAVSKEKELKKKKVEKEEEEEEAKKKKVEKEPEVKKKRERKVYDLPGQKRDQPEERDPLRIFYESLYMQVIIRTEGTLARLAELMKDHGDLLRAYSVLFPKANITVPPEAYQALGPNQTITGTSVSRKNKEASLYMASVKEAFDDEPAKYKEFLKVLKDVRARRIDVASAIVVVEKLMKDNRDLFRGFVVVFAAKPTIIISSKAKEKIVRDEYKRKLVDPSNGADFMNKRQNMLKSKV